MIHSANATTDNPFGAPTKLDPAQVTLPPDESYRVVEDTLVCRGDVQLTDICGVTGSRENLISTTTFRKSVTPAWVYLLLAIPISLLALCMALNVSDRIRIAIVQLLFFGTPIYLVVAGVLTSRKVRVKVGLSGAGRRILRLNAIARMLTWFVCLAGASAGWYLISNSDIPYGTNALRPLGFIFAGVVAAWGIASVAIRFVVGPSPFRPALNVLPSGHLAVTGLRREFLFAIHSGESQHEWADLT